MPYSGASDPSLPKYVKKLPLEKRKQWVAVFESVLSDGGDESKAFASANAAVKKHKGLIMELWSVDERQLDQKLANYSPLGATPEKGCGGCNWYVPSDDGCLLVKGDISPTGVCDHFMSAADTEMEPEVEPVPVYIVKPEVEKSLIDRVYEAVKALFIKGVAPIPPVQSDQPTKSTFRFYKSSDQLRFLAVYSNNFKDKQGETLRESAHLEYVDWATKTGNYPDLWLWHSGPASKWGKVDFLDYVSGFSVASGLIDKDKEYLADTLEKEELGVSHGFNGLITKDGDIVRYRTFEISPLPAWAAANEWTPVKLKEIMMPFNPDKRKWLSEVAKMPDETITEWEKSLEGLSNDLKALGVEYKESGPDDITGQIASLTGVVADLAKSVSAIVGQVKELSKDTDTKIADYFKAEVAKLPQGFKASETDTNVVDQKKDDNMEWFLGALGVKK